MNLWNSFGVYLMNTTSPQQINRKPKIKCVAKYFLHTGTMNHTQNLLKSASFLVMILAAHANPILIYNSRTRLIIFVRLNFVFIVFVQRKSPPPKQLTHRYTVAHSIKCETVILGSSAAAVSWDGACRPSGVPEDRPLPHSPSQWTPDLQLGLCPQMGGSSLDPSC